MGMGLNVWQQKVLFQAIEGFKPQFVAKYSTYSSIFGQTVDIMVGWD